MTRVACFFCRCIFTFSHFHPLKLRLGCLALVREVIHYIFFLLLSGTWLNICDLVRLSCFSRLTPLCPPHAGLMVWSLWPIYFVCNAGKLDSLFPDDSYIDMGEIDVGRKVAQQIPPGIFWRSQVFIDHPMYVKFNVSLSKDALVGIYGRRGLPPSHTQVGKLCYNFYWVLISPSSVINSKVLFLHPIEGKSQSYLWSCVKQFKTSSCMDVWIQMLFFTLSLCHRI